MELHIIYSDRQGNCDFETISTKILGEGTIIHSSKDNFKTTRYETNSKYLNCSGGQWVDIKDGEDYAEERGLNSGFSGSDLFGYRKRFYLDKFKASEYYVDEQKRIEEKYVKHVENSFKINQAIKSNLDDNYNKVMKVVFIKGIPYFILSILITFGLIYLIFLLTSPLIEALIFYTLMILFTLSIIQIIKVIHNKVLDKWNWNETFKNTDKILEELENKK